MKEICEIFNCWMKLTESAASRDSSTRSDNGVLLTVNRSKNLTLLYARQAGVDTGCSYSILVSKLCEPGEKGTVTMTTIRSDALETDMHGHPLWYVCADTWLNSQLWWTRRFRDQLWAALYSGWSSWWTAPPLTWFPDLRYQPCATARKKTRKEKKHGRLISMVQNWSNQAY